MILGRCHVYEEEGQLHGLYVSTPKMQNFMTNNPQFLAIDGTYKVLSNGFIVVLVMVIDANGMSEFAGMRLIKSENEEIFDWFLRQFEADNHAACKSIKSVITDKQPALRKCLRKIFPHASLYLCVFHTLQAMKRKVMELKIEPELKLEVLAILDKLVKSSNENQYTELHKILLQQCPSAMVEYFEKHWHPIREQWTMYNMTNGNGGETTNNRLESMNKQLKDAIGIRVSMLKFFHLSLYCAVILALALRSAQYLYYRQPLTAVRLNAFKIGARSLFPCFSPTLVHGRAFPPPPT